MHAHSRRFAKVILKTCAFLAVSAVAAVAAPPTTGPSRDLSHDKTLYVVAYAHLDTQWRWTYPQVIRDYIPDTLRSNFELFEKYPSYVFNFSGSRRYEMAREYYPEDYEKLKKYIAQGRWFPCGSSVDENDNNVPSAESHIRHVLYGNNFFRREFGVASNEYMLPDCFGFTAALPSILAHCGIKGFSTQKLTWGSANGIPFKVGVWEGVDGQSIVAALDPGSYGGKVTEDLSRKESWITRIENNGKASGVYADYHYYGTGDIGGSPQEQSVEWMEKSVHGDGPIRVVASRADELFLDITDQQRAKLPHYKGELLLTEHSAGAITSQAYMKRWNRKNELLADAAERASVAAMWLGGASYPSKKLYDAWVLVLGSQMHDMLPGTSVPKAYEYCWNDELLALNQFADVATHGVSVVASQMDTRAQGVPLVVYNPLSAEREDVVEATVRFEGSVPSALDVVGPDGKATPAQVIGRSGNDVKVAFLAKAPSVGFVTYDVQPAAGASPVDLKVDEKSLENARFRVTLNDDGDIASIFDKQNNKEALSGPSRLALLYENPAQFPAWNMDWNDRKNPPRSYVTGPAKVRVVEDGPVRVALEVTREHEGSRFIQRISLATGGAGDRVEVANKIDWATREHSLKATFPMSISSPKATYDIAVGALERATNDEKKFEVPQHQWFDLTSPDGAYGVAVLNDCKYGSDKPDERTLRLTMVHTPGVRGGYRDQATQDVGRHDITYAIAPHAGDWRAARVPHVAARVNQPLRAFQTPAHEGSLGKSFSLLRLNTDQVAVQAIKKAEDSDEVIVRLKELTGKQAGDVRVSFASQIASAREVDGQEREIGAATVQDGALATDLGGYRMRAFALKLSEPQAKAASVRHQPVQLAYDLDAVSSDANRADGAFDSEGRTLAAEQLPAQVVNEGITFNMGPARDGEKNALACRGQTIQLPAGFDRVYVLAAAIDGDQPATFKIGDRAIEETIQEWTGYIGQWDNRLWQGEVNEDSHQVNNPWNGLVPGYVKRDSVAWFCSHRHHPTRGNEFYRYSYLFKYGFDVPQGATSITLPDNEKVRVFAVTVAKDAHDDVRPAQPLYDTLEDHNDPSLASRPSVLPAGGKFDDVTTVALVPPLYWKGGRLRYTLDGSEPTAQSPAYEKPLLVHKTVKVRAREFDDSGKAGPEVAAQIDVNDTTPPQVRSVAAVSVVPTVTIEFSEPLDEGAAAVPANYRFDPPAKVESANVSEDGKVVTLKLAQPPTAANGAAEPKLTIVGVGDASPAANKVTAEPLSVPVASPLFTLDSFKCTGDAKEQRVEGLPTRSGDKWTINVWVKPEKQPESRTIIAGFGRCEDDVAGAGRYLAKFGSGIHFWARNRDVTSRTQLDVGKWQMLTATYDGKLLRLYKDAQPIGRREIALDDDAESVVRIGPADPWDKTRRFSGEVRNLTIWPAALPREALEALQKADADRAASAK